MCFACETNGPASASCVCVGGGGQVSQRARRRPPPPPLFRLHRFNTQAHADNAKSHTRNLVFGMKKGRRRKRARGKGAVCASAARRLGEQLQRRAHIFMKQDRRAHAKGKGIIWSLIRDTEGRVVAEEKKRHAVSSPPPRPRSALGGGAKKLVFLCACCAKGR